jgi:hypothetical protein
MRYTRGILSKSYVKGFIILDELSLGTDSDQNLVFLKSSFNLFYWLVSY